MQRMKAENIKAGKVIEVIKTVEYPEDIPEFNIKQGDRQILKWKFLRNILYYQRIDRADDLLYDTPSYPIIPEISSILKPNEEFMVLEGMSLETPLWLMNMENPTTQKDFWKIKNKLLNGELQKRKLAKKNSIIMPKALYLPNNMLEQLDAYGGNLESFQPHPAEGQILKLK